MNKATITEWLPPLRPIGVAFAIAFFARAAPAGVAARTKRAALAGMCVRGS
jgi:hypothetical protein